jgi:malonyl-CoA O-methyltransferase
MLVKRDIQRRFDRAAGNFDETDFVHAVTRQGLVERLEPLVLDARTILDLGAATGAMGHALRKRFRRAHVVALDLSHPMLTRARRRMSWFAAISRVQADAEKLPFADGSLDLVVANQLLPWLPDPAQAFSEVARVLKKGGVFAFATLGPDSFSELAAAWAAADTGRHVHRFADMHDIGDALVRARLRDPVLDVDRLTVTFENYSKLFADLTRAGARNSLVDRDRGLVGRQRFQAMTEALADTHPDGRIRLNLELVYGHCWGCGPGNGAGEFRVDPSRIPLRR